MQKQYSFKDAYIILKRVAKQAESICKSKENVIIRQLENTNDRQYRSDFYGLLNLKTNAEKTAKVYTAKEQKQVDELQAQIDELQAQIDKLGKEVIVKEAYNSLVCNGNSTADDEAKELLADLIASMGNASMIKASKTKKQ